MRVTFDNALLSFLPNIAELTPVIGTPRPSLCLNLPPLSAWPISLAWPHHPDNLREARSEEAARESLHSQNVRLVFMGDNTVGKVHVHGRDTLKSLRDEPHRAF